MKNLHSLFFGLLLCFVLFSCDTDYVNQDKTFSRKHGEVGFFYAMLGNAEGHAKVRYSDKFGLAPADKVFEKHNILGTADLPTLYKAGYIFDGWFNGSEQAVPGVFSVEKNVTFVSKWTPITYTVYFYPNNSSGASPLTQEFTYDTKAKLLANTFTPETHDKFVGWATSTTGSISFNDEQEVLNLRDYQSAVVSLYAVWIDVDAMPIVYHGYDSVTDTVSGDLPNFYHTNDAISIPSLQREGCTFLGWYDNQYFDGTPITGWEPDQKSGTVDLYAKWTPCWKVHFDKNGADASGDFADVEVNDANSFLLPANPFTRDKYFFEGWSLEPDGSGANYSAGQNVSVTSNMTFYAKWHAYRYITFDANGGDGASMDVQRVSDGISTALSANTYTRAPHYTFGGWNTKADGTGVSYKDKQSVAWKSDITLYAQWTPVKYSITFNSNKPANETGSISGTTKSQEIPYGTSSVVDSCSFTATHYTFKCWNTKADGSGKPYYAKNNSYKISLSENITVYAQWTGKTYTITYNANGNNHKTSAGATSYTQDYTWGSKVTLDANKFLGSYSYTYLYDKDGEGVEDKRTKTLIYNLDGWSTSKNSATRTYTPGQSISVCTLGDINLYAVWKSPKSYIIYHANMDDDYYCNWGSEFVPRYWTDSVSVVECTTPNHTVLDNVSLNWSIPSYVSTGSRVFLGWSTSSEGYVEYTNKITVDTTKPIDLYGMWYHGDNTSFPKSSNSSDNTPYNVCVEKYETTKGNFYKVMGRYGFEDYVDADKYEYPVCLRKGTTSIPKIEMSTIFDYCNELSSYFGYNRVYSGNLSAPNDVKQDISKNGFRLPTQDEWKYFALYSFGGVDPGNSDDLFNQYAWYKANSDNKAHPVGTKQYNNFGLYDVVGNISELTVYNNTNIYYYAGGDYYYYSYGGSFKSPRGSITNVRQNKFGNDTDYDNDQGFRLFRTIP